MNPLKITSIILALVIANTVIAFSIFISNTQNAADNEEIEVVEVMEVSDFLYEEESQLTEATEESEPEEEVESEYYEEPSYEETYYQESYQSSDYGNSFKSAGVVYGDDGTRYTWYSQRVLPGGGLTELNNNGRHVNDEGFVCDGDGYIAISSSDHEQGTIIDTPFGEGKVYDSGCASGTIDVYTDF